MTVTVQGGELSQREVQAYIDHIQEKMRSRLKL